MPWLSWLSGLGGLTVEGFKTLRVAVSVLAPRKNKKPAKWKCLDCGSMPKPQISAVHHPEQVDEENVSYCSCLAWTAGILQPAQTVKSAGLRSLRQKKPS